MSTPRFFTLLAIVTAVDIVGVALFHFFLPIGYSLPFSVATVLLFLIVTAVIFFLGRRSAGAANKMLFSNVFLGATMVKMLLCGMLVVGYVFLGDPGSRLFIIPFFWSYLVYTGYEVYFLMKLSGVVAESPGA